MSCSGDLPRITAIIPTYNRAGVLGRAIDSVLAQTMAADEVVVVDDGSTDGTHALVAGLGDVVTYVYQDNSGASMARNTGVATARGDWLAFLDSDDVWLPHYLERVAAAIAATEGRGLMYFAD
ncbi:MAG: glycosyltransferase family 2 protein, partial [Solirubrobacteraceae bacterium]